MDAFQSFYGLHFNQNYRLRTSNSTPGRYLKLFPIKNRNLFLIFVLINCENCTPKKSFCRNEEEGIIYLHDEVERCPKDSIIKYFRLSYSL